MLLCLVRYVVNVSKGMMAEVHKVWNHIITGQETPTQYNTMLYLLRFHAGSSVLVKVLKEKTSNS